MRKITFSLVLSLFSSIALGQSLEVKEEGMTVFKPHTYIQLQGGAGYTLGESKITDLISPAAALNLGHRFSPVFSMRLGASGWKANGAWVSPKQLYDYKYVQGNLDLLLDLGSLWAGFNPHRVVNTYVFGGAGYAYAFDNDKANALNTNGYLLEYLWKDKKGFVAGRLGLGFDFRLSDYVSFVLEGNANALSDHFNSKKAGNADWQFNALAGIKINLGKGYTKTEPLYIESVVPVTPPAVVEPKPAPKPEPREEEPVAITVAPLQENIFFVINTSKIEPDQQSKIDALANYLTEHPGATVSITGYADVDTGTQTINKKLSEKRANNVAEALIAKGVDRTKIAIDYKGDAVQPFSTPEENRVAVCIAE